LYNFYLDPEILKDGGHFSAVTHALEVSFRTDLLALQGRKLIFTERGERLDGLAKFLKNGVKKMSPAERVTFEEAWLERLITAAIDSGARIPSRKRKAATRATDDNLPSPVAKKSKPVVINIDDNSDSEYPSSIPMPPPSAAASTSAQPSASNTIRKDKVLGNPKQVTLGAFGWQKAKPGEVDAYWAKVKEERAESHEQVLAAKKKKVENQQQCDRDLARIRQQRRRAKLKAAKEEEEPEVDPDDNASTVLMRGADMLAQGTSTIPDVASLSRPATQGKTGGGAGAAPSRTA
jgi:hypothetical protein